ncbi:MAG: dihydropteroate synthase [Verrucomicrobia bacterium]|nr:dihydropteroate synthase [Verrucomicrobiota bacterium]
MKLMGILNVTPDSFFDGGAYITLNQAIERGLLLEKEGAVLIDVGGASSHPRSPATSEEIELHRVLPVIEALSSTLSIPISIDTFHPRIAKEALKKGATWINDITGFENPQMRQLAVDEGPTICVMHRQDHTFYPEEIVTHLLRFFEKQCGMLEGEGVCRSQIVIDPGISFGKTAAQNLAICGGIGRLKELGFPVLIGASRKGFLRKLQSDPDGDLLLATLALHAFCSKMGADLLRVHDVKKHQEINLLFC